MSGLIVTLAETATATGVFSSITSETFVPLVEELKSVAPVMVGLTVTLSGIRKAWSWLRSGIRGA